jgi:uncharacterized protein YkwD
MKPTKNMKKLIFFCFVTCLFGCPPAQKTETAEPTPSGCGKDTDCKGDRVCIRSTCQTPNPKDTGPRQGKWLTLGESAEEPETSTSLGVPGQKVAPTAALEEAVLAKMNAYRASQKLPPLASAKQLQEAAQNHSQEMFLLGYFSHQSPTAGMQTFLDRIKAAGATGFSTGGENIIYREGNLDDASLADALLKQWLDSPPHKANILSKEYFVTGLGFYRDGAKVWGTQVFVDRLSGM